VVNRAGAEIKPVRRGESPAPAGHLLLEPPGIDVHRSIARTFLETVPEDMKARLLAALEKSSEGWWQTWLRELRGSAHLGAWNTFRRLAFENRLREQLSAAAVSERDIEHALAAIRDRHLAVAEVHSVGPGPASEKSGVVDRAGRLQLRSSRELEYLSP